jgi:hypothetical protein
MYFPHLKITHNTTIDRTGRNSDPQLQNETEKFAAAIAELDENSNPQSQQNATRNFEREQEEPRACDTSKIASEGFELRTQGGKGTQRREICERNKGRERPNSNREKLQHRCTPEFPLFPCVRFVIPAIMDSSSKPLILFLFVF